MMNALVDSPLNLDLSCQNWSAVIAKDSYADTELLVICYGKAHALFHATTFIDISVCRDLIAKNVRIFKYFNERLLMPFGKHDQRLTELNTEYDVWNCDASRIRTFQKSLRANNLLLPITVFIHLLDEGYKQLFNANKELLSKSSNSASSHIISQALLEEI